MNGYPEALWHKGASDGEHRLPLDSAVTHFRGDERLLDLMLVLTPDGEEPFDFACMHGHEKTFCTLVDDYPEHFQRHTTSRKAHAQRLLPMHCACANDTVGESTMARLFEICDRESAAAFVDCRAVRARGPGGKIGQCSQNSR